MLRRGVRLVSALMVSGALWLGASSAAAQDAGGPGSLPDCPGAISTADIPLMGERMGPVDMLPGTGVGMVGSMMFGMRYNLLFSGEYRLRMAGTLHVHWLDGRTPLTITTTGAAGTGNLYVRYGLRMMATLYVVGTAIPIDLSSIIMDNEGTGMRSFDPWQWEYSDASLVALNVSAYRTIYMNSVTVGGETYPYELQMRFNMQTRAKTMQIEFPNRAGGAMNTSFGALNGTTSSVNVAVPANGNLDLAYRWMPRIRYTGAFQFRLVVRRRVCVAGICSNVDVPTPDLGSIPLENELLPTAWERSTPVLLPLALLNEPEVDFGMVRIGTTGMQQLIVLNPGASPLALTVSRPGDPSFQVTTSTACVPPSGMASLPVTFMPSSMGSFRSEVTVQSNGASNNPARVALLGIGASETRPPPARDGGASSSDGGARSDGGRIMDVQAEAGCACRASVARPRVARSTWALAAGLALSIGLRRRVARRAAGR